MRKLFGLALVCGLAFGGCKCSSDSSSATSSTSDDKPAAADTSSKHGRSGKVDLGSRRNPSASGDTAGGDSSGDTPKPSLPQDRRNARMAEFDTDHDGKISDEERKAARHKRAEDMLKNADKNGDGKVSPDELTEGNFRRINTATIDTNKDGNVTVDELEAAIEARSKQWGAGRFGRIDRGGGPGGRLRPAPPMGGTGGSAVAPAPDSPN